MTQQSQTDSELEVFSQFVRLNSAEIDLETIIKLHSPSPDIECKTLGGEGRAYELVEFLDQGYQRTLQHALSAQELLYRFAENLPKEERDRSNALFGDADITVIFNDDCSKNAVRTSLPSIFAELMKFEPGVEDQICSDKFSDSKLSKSVSAINISRGINGPCFNPHAIARVGDPCVDTIADKLSKDEPYRTEYPLELVAYIMGNPMFPENVWRPRLLNYLEAKDSILPFRKIWVLDLRRTKISLEWGDK